MKKLTKKQIKQAKDMYDGLFNNIEKINILQSSIEKLDSESEKLLEISTKNHKHLEGIYEKYQINSGPSAAEFMNGLPLNGLKKFQEFECGKKIHHNLHVWNEVSKFKKLIAKEQEEIFNLDDKVDLLRIELLQEKIKHILEIKT